MTDVNEKTLMEMWQTLGVGGTEVAREGDRRIAELRSQLGLEPSAESTNTPRDLLGWLYRCQTPKSEQGDGTWSDGVQELLDVIVSAIERLQRDVDRAVGKVA